MSIVMEKIIMEISKQSQHFSKFHAERKTLDYGRNRKVMKISYIKLNKLNKNLES